MMGNDGVAGMIADDSEDGGFDDGEDRSVEGRRVNDDELEEEVAGNEPDADHSLPDLDYEEDSPVDYDEESSDSMDDYCLEGTD
mmetsp:Transcript_19327/g.31718  ORF Transcript_19327/g.31718 Transcript_19327/m.31718 type:complete len:84 (-) Transcript_19327:606-857(-)